MVYNQFCIQCPEGKDSDQLELGDSTHGYNFEHRGRKSSNGSGSDRSSLPLVPIDRDGCQVSGSHGLSRGQPELRQEVIL